MCKSSNSALSFASLEYYVRSKSYFQGPYNIVVNAFGKCINKSDTIDMSIQLKKVGNDYVAKGNYSLKKAVTIDGVRFFINVMYIYNVPQTV